MSLPFETKKIDNKFINYFFIFLNILAIIGWIYFFYTQVIAFSGEVNPLGNVLFGSLMLLFWLVILSIPNLYIFLYPLIQERLFHSFNKIIQGNIISLEEYDPLKYIPFVISKYWLLKVEAVVPELSGTYIFTQKVRPWHIETTLEEILITPKFDIYYQSKNPKKKFKIQLPIGSE